MSYDIIIRFPNKELAEEFTGQMSDGFGEGFCDFSVWQKIPGSSGKRNKDFIKITELDVPVCFVNEIFEQ
jgi:hypothetical protein